MCEQWQKPFVIIQLDATVWEVSRTREWIQATGHNTLNVAGPREGKRPGIYTKALLFLEQLELARALLEQ